MPVQALTKIDPQQFFNLSSATGAGTQRLDPRPRRCCFSSSITGDSTASRSGLIPVKSLVFDLGHWAVSRTGRVTPLPIDILPV